jgi:RluA family pseudouridine synthase
VVDGLNLMTGSIKLSSPATREFWEIPILFEDESLFALDKPRGLLTSPHRFDPQRPSLMKLMHCDIERGAVWARQRRLGYLANAHRLDFETSGVILLAKNKPALNALADQFGTEKPVRICVTLVQGGPEGETFEIGAKLAPHPVEIGQARVDPRHGKKCRTRFEVLERFSGYTLLRCRAFTWRPHQIRVHLQHAGVPVVGDSLYGGQPLLLSALKREYRLKGNKTERPLISGVTLHAEQLGISHPTTGETITITAPWPKDLKVAVKYLRRYARSSGAETGGKSDGSPP